MGITMMEKNTIGIEELKWAIFLYNTFGEYGDYIYDSLEVRKGIERGEPGTAVVSFLNHFRMRVSGKRVPPLINKWYADEGMKLLDSLKSPLSETDLNSDNVSRIITQLYDGLTRISSIKATSASKILHILRPELFVMWDNEISRHYQQNSDMGKGEESYVHFLRRMQAIIKDLQAQNNQIAKLLSRGVVRFFEGNLESLDPGKDEERISQLKKSIDFLNSGGITLPKFIDEYNWVVFSKKIKVPPDWTPCSVDL